MTRLKNLTLGLLLLSAIVATPASTIAAPNTEVRKDVTPEKTTDPKNFSPLRDSLMISEPTFSEIKSSRKKSGTHNFPSRTSVHAAWLSGKLNLEAEAVSVGAVGFERTQYNINDTAQEFGLVMSANSLVMAHTGYKWIYNPDWLFGKPFIRLSLAGFYDPKEFLANLINYRRYSVMGAVGFDDLFSLDRHLKVDLIVTGGTIGSAFGISASWAL